MNFETAIIAIMFIVACSPLLLCLFDKRGSKKESEWRERWIEENKHLIHRYRVGKHRKEIQRCRNIKRKSFMAFIP